MPDPNLFLGRALLGLGALGVAAGIFAAGRPAAVCAGLQAFPRSKSPGWILAAIGTFWACWVIFHAALGRFEVVKPLIPVLGVATFAAIVYFLDDMLAPRALGGLLLLVANPLFTQTFALSAFANRRARRINSTPIAPDASRIKAMASFAAATQTGDSPVE